MPPKANENALAQATKDTAFLASCFKHMKQRPDVDAAAVAAELGLSTGGVRNKLRPILKAMEEDGAAWLNEKATASTPKRGGGAKPKANTPRSDAKNEGISDNDDRDLPAASKQTTKAAVKKTTKAIDSGTKRGRKAKDAGIDAGEATAGNATPSKKARITSMTSTEDDDGNGVEVKEETGSAVDSNGAGGSEPEMKRETEDE